MYSHSNVYCIRNYFAVIKIVLALTIKLLRHPFTTQLRLRSSGSNLAISDPFWREYGGFSS